MRPRAPPRTPGSKALVRLALPSVPPAARCVSSQGVLGVQLVGTLLAATLLHRLAPHCSFARWLLCNGSLYRYKHPSEEELRALAAPQRPRGRRERWANGCGEDRPLWVPRDAPFQLQTCPLTAVDALVLRFFAEYQWFLDFAVYAAALFVLTEGYYHLLAPCEPNIAVFWGLLAVAFSAKVLMTITRLYFGAGASGERSVCLAFALLSLLLAMLVQALPEATLELGLEPGLASLTETLEPLLRPQGWDWAVPVVRLAVRAGLAAVGSLLGAGLVFPGLRLAQTHRDSLAMAEGRPLLQLLLHAGFLSPLLVLWFWVKPIARDLLLQPRPAGALLSDAAFDSLRLWALVALVALRLAGTRPHLQAYLCLARARVEQLRREAGRIEAREVQRRVVRVYCYVTVVSLQYLTPLVLTLHCALLLKVLGGYSWGLGPAAPLPPPPAHPQGPAEDEAQQTAARIAGALGGLLSPLLLRGLLSFLLWWTAACQGIAASVWGHRPPQFPPVAQQPAPQNCALHRSA
ncbi:transmembrane protein 161A isoform X1 [Erinaceus europaeus]|uniref:Transmembrane protein 161A n=1 Tax=Erinaceus europaeus TaxID=9365 RepID=A0ABM3WP31_ERIEU|nr:transmembrane protein 161A isoform X1 [Erinaceus europaeus]